MSRLNLLQFLAFLTAVVSACSAPLQPTAVYTADLGSSDVTSVFGKDGVELSDADTASDASDLDAPDDVTALDDAAPDASTNPCANLDCSGHGVCVPLYDQAYCKCDTGFYLLGATECADVNIPGPCNPNPCVEPDKTACTNGAGQPLCACAPGFYDVDGVCTFQSCPAIVASTGVIIYDGTGTSLAVGLDPLLPSDTVQLRVEIAVTNGKGAISLELHPYNLSLEPLRLACDGVPCAGKMKGPLLLVPLQLTPGAHSVELTGKFLTNQAPLSLNARLVADAGCELPGSRSGARIGALGVQDAKGMDCIDLDRTRAVQVTHDIAEKSTSDYGAANGQATQYQPVASIVNVVAQCFSRKTDSVLFLAGDPLGVLPWAVDNDLVIERYDAQPTPGAVPSAVLQIGTDSVTSNQGVAVFLGPKPDVPGTHFGIPNSAPFGFSAGHVRLDALIPPGKPVWLRFVALDYGSVGRLTRLHVIAVPHDQQPRRCIDNTQCPDGKGGAVAGCVDGQCAGAACNPSTPCPSNQFCAGGFCTSRCDQGVGNCASGLVCKVRGCVAPGTIGVCDSAQKDQDCPAGQICLAGRCETGCHHPRKQDQSYAQDPTFCAGNMPGLCPHCPDPKQGCWNNVCSECEVDAACATGLVCVDRKCVAPW
jgi:hypothetical protein